MTRSGGNRVIIILAICILVVIGGGYFVVRNGSFAPQFLRRIQRGGSEGILTAVADISQLETLAYVRRTVFPHDYLQPDLNMTTLVRVITAQGGDPETALSDAELTHFHAANLASELGLATRREQSGYVVVTAIYRFGYEVDTLIRHFEARQDAPDQFADFPEGALLSVEIEDLRGEAYPYGPVRLDAEGWRRVTDFVIEEGLPPDLLSDMVTRSKEQGVSILRRLVPQ